VLDSSPGGSYDQLFYRPTVLANVPPEARAYKEEIFGPVAPSVAFNAVDKAARFAAQTDSGLSLAIMTTDIMRGLALAERVSVGMVHINDQTSTDEPIAPFGAWVTPGTGTYRRPGGESGGVHRNAVGNGQPGARELPILMASIADEFRDEEICKEAVIVSEPHRRRRVPLRWFASKSLHSVQRPNRTMAGRVPSSCPTPGRLAYTQAAPDYGVGMESW
jgi:hypothetical protein